MPLRVRTLMVIIAAVALSFSASRTYHHVARCRRMAAAHASRERFWSYRASSPGLPDLPQPWAAAQARHFAAMERKWRAAAFRPWASVERDPDPPLPKNTAVPPLFRYKTVAR